MAHNTGLVKEMSRLSSEQARAEVKADEIYKLSLKTQFVNWYIQFALIQVIYGNMLFINKY